MNFMITKREKSGKFCLDFRQREVYFIPCHVRNLDKISEFIKNTLTHINKGIQIFLISLHRCLYDFTRYREM